MDIAENIKRLSGELPPGVRIVAVSKTRTPGEIMQLYASGHRIFGENKVQEMVEKRDALPDDIEWHMVGHLQSNKVKYIARFVSLIHSVDSLKLLETIDKEARKINRVIDCLLQVHIASEESKFGFARDEISGLMRNFEAENYPGVRIRGLMGMATFTDDEALVRFEFQKLAGLFRTIRESFFSNSGYFTELSMGMSGDYKIAAEEGSTVVRIGSLIFGVRENY